MGKQTREYRIRKRKEALQVLGGTCVRCGFTDWRALQIDHINGGGASERRANGGTGTISRYIEIVEDPDEAKLSLQILCANCNWIKRYEEGESGKRY